jgi:hypothetical protein
MRKIIEIYRRQSRNIIQVKLYRVGILTPTFLHAPTHR